MLILISVKRKDNLMIMLIIDSGCYDNIINIMHNVMITVSILYFAHHLSYDNLYIQY